MNEQKYIMRTLKKNRQGRGISSSYISQEVGISPSQLSRLESGNIDLRLSTFLRYLESIKIRLILERTKGNEQ